MSEIGKDLDAKIRLSAKDRCGYCLVPQRLVSYKLEIEHLLPKFAGGSSLEEDLWLSCRQCNLSKGTKTKGFDAVTFQNATLFSPRTQKWSDHFEFSDDETEIIGKTATGRATVSALNLNSNLQRTARELWRLTGAFPPKIYDE